MSLGRLSAITLRRIQVELKEWGQQAPEGCCLESCEPVNQWIILMQGPDGLPGMNRFYEGQLYKLKITFDGNYPLEPPEVIFVETPPIHPHIYSNGHICLDILYNGRNGSWTPALTISKVCLSLRSMLASNQTYQRPQGDEDYSRRTVGRSPKLTSWLFDDDTV